MELKDKEFSLVLSGGSALGYAHLGIIKYLEENDLRPKEVIGTSMGAIIGSAYAYGYSYDEISDIIKKSELISILDYGWGNPSILMAKKLESLFDRLFEEKKLSDTIIPLKIVATDLETGMKKCFSREDDIEITKAIRASTALPIIFPPININEKDYVDGYISSNLPVEFADKNNVILAIDVMNKKKVRPFKITRTFFFKKIKDMFKIYERMMFMMMLNQTRDKLNQYDNVILVEPDVSSFSAIDFKKWELISEKGYEEIKKII